jgi:hypothetical protein
LPACWARRASRRYRSLPGLARLFPAVDDDVERKVDGFRVVAYDIPEGCIAGYYPECNPLLPLWHHEEKSKTPAAKAIPVGVQRQMERA